MSERNYYTGPKATAWDAVKKAYARRVGGSMADFEPPQTDFDYAAVAAAAPLPGPPNPNWQRSLPNNPNPHYRATYTAFLELRELFEREWG